MEYILSAFRKPIMKKLLTLTVVVLLLYILRDMLNLLLLTFLFTYLMYNLQKSFQKMIQRITKLKISRVLITLVLYVIFIALLVLAVYKYIPIAVKQILNIINDIVAIIVAQKGMQYGNPILDFLIAQLNTIDIGKYIGGKSSYLFSIVGDIGQIGLSIFLSLILSLFFILEKDRVVRFVLGFKESKIAGFFNEVQFFGDKLLNSFGKVIQAQILIALCNTLLSVVGLSILGFPQLIGLAVMIFVLSLIPVAGVAISLVPLSIIAFNIGGFKYIIYVIVLITIIHAVESYFLNPKLMSVKTDLPVFFTFLVLILSEHFMGIWGLIIGIPIFIFLLDILGFKILTKNELEQIKKNSINKKDV
jgi:predicted PurR-regulated permease PerM